MYLLVVMKMMVNIIKLLNEFVSDEIVLLCEYSVCSISVEPPNSCCWGSSWGLSCSPLGI